MHDAVFHIGGDFNAATWREAWLPSGGAKTPVAGGTHPEPPPGMVTIDAGTDWANAPGTTDASALLAVPSVIVPDEWNALINPAHPDVARISATKMQRWAYDARLYKP